MKRFTSYMKARLVNDFLRGKDIGEEMREILMSNEELQMLIRHWETARRQGLKQLNLQKVRKEEKGVAATA